MYHSVVVENRWLRWLRTCSLLVQLFLNKYRLIIGVIFRIRVFSASVGTISAFACVKPQVYLVEQYPTADGYKVQRKGPLQNSRVTYPTVRCNILPDGSSRPTGQRCAVSELPLTLTEPHRSKGQSLQRQYCWITLAAEAIDA